MANIFEELLKPLQKPLGEANYCFRNNSMVVNPGKYQSIIIDKKKNYNPSYLNVGNKAILSANC